LQYIHENILQTDLKAQSKANCIEGSQDSGWMTSISGRGTESTNYLYLPTVTQE